MLRAVRSRIQPGSFPLFLATTLCLYLVNGSAVESTAAGVLGRVVVAGAGIYVLSTTRIRFWFAVVIVALVVSCEFRWWPVDPRIGRVLLDTTTTVFLLGLLFVVLREVFRPGTTEQDAVVGALCGFLILLLVFVRVHGLIEALYPGSYRDDGFAFAERSDAVVLATFQYFSTITLTTVGFGDIVPIGPAARIATGLEAIIGQLYLAVVIATLVGRVASRPK